MWDGTKQGKYENYPHTLHPTHPIQFLLGENKNKYIKLDRARMRVIRPKPTPL